ncbi:MAG: carbamoyltransferase N-terminal domain-containing protein, partial [Candidatus Tectomicrobia bacterium]
MIVLGISPLDKDATVSLVADGDVVFAAGEERFSRNKLQDGFPAEALQAGLDTTGIDLKEVDIVAYPFFDSQKETQLFTKNMRHEEQFLDEFPYGAMRARIDAALA